MLIKRILSAAVLIPLVGLVMYLGGWYLTIVLMLVGLLATWEYLALVQTTGLRPIWPVALLFVPLALIDALYPDWHIARLAVFALAAVALSVEVFHGNREGSLQSWGVTTASLYIAMGLAFFLSLRELPQGLYWVAMALLGTWISDTGAYMVGSWWGRRRLAPAISPKKSWEGVWGGLVTGVPVVWAIARFGLGMPHWQGVVLGCVLVAAATIGDLAESVIKRQAGVKDSGSLIPGHGGMLDRVDSLLFVAPAMYYCALLLTGAM